MNLLCRGQRVFLHNPTRLFLHHTRTPLIRAYCTVPPPPPPPNNNANNNNNHNNVNNTKPKRDYFTDSSVLLVEKSLADKTYQKFYFLHGAEDNAENDKPKSNVGQSKILLFLKQCFLPEGYPHSVAKDYTQYQIWQFVQNVAGSTAYVLATHACLTSVGVGTETASPVAATMNWLLRDGLGCIGLVLYAGKFATNLDADIKRSKFLGDILHNFGVGIEILTPLFPGKFLLLASIGNAMKAIAGLILGATKASFNKMFSLNENMADVTAKYQSQGLVAYLGGMGIGIGLAHVIPNVYGHFTAFLFLSSIHLWASVRGLNKITLNTLNEQRLNILLEEYFTTGTIVNPSRAKQFERLFVIKTQTERPSICLGVNVKDAFSDFFESLRKAIQVHGKENHLISYRNDQFRVVLREGVSQMDLLRAYFHAYYLKATLFTISKRVHEDLRAMDNTEWLDKVANWRRQNASDELKRNASLPAGWIEKGLEFTNRNFESFVLRLECAGWNTSNIPLPVKDMRSWWRRE